MKNEIRLLTNKEQEVVNALISFSASKWAFLKDEISTAKVSEMQDGGMGSLLFSPGTTEVRTLGLSIAEAEFLDVDGAAVSVVLNLDKNDKLFELDVWKYNFEPLISFPDIKKLKAKKVWRSNAGNAH